MSLYSDNLIKTEEVINGIIDIYLDHIYYNNNQKSYENFQCFLNNHIFKKEIIDKHAFEHKV